MKKLLLALLTTTIISTSSATVVSCTSSNYYGGLYLITDAGKIDDKSFNQAAFEAGREFLTNVMGIDKKIAYIQPKDTTPKKLDRSYKTAKTNGAKSLILPGFHHALPNEGNHNGAKTMKGTGSTVLLDASQNGENEIGVNFRGDVSGFYAGMSAIIYSLQNNNYSNNTLSLGAFGGISNPASVDNFIVGYLAAIDVYNKEEIKPIIQEKFKIPDQAKGVTVRKAQKQYPSSKDDLNWFSNSFLIGQSKNVLDNITDSNKAYKPNVMMAVAGPQTNDVINYSKDWMLVGVDTNQVESFPQASTRFITSAEKDLKNSTIVSLAHTPEWKNELVNGEKVWEIVSKKYKGKIALTVQDAPGEEFKEVSLDNDDSWIGKDIWVNGTMSSGGNNKLTEQTATEIKELFTPEILTETSIELFSRFINGNETPSTGTIINDVVVKAYAESIINAFSSETEGKK